MVAHGPRVPSRGLCDHTRRRALAWPRDRTDHWFAMHGSKKDGRVTQSKRLVLSGFMLITRTKTDMSNQWIETWISGFLNVFTLTFPV